MAKRYIGIISVCLGAVLFFFTNCGDSEFQYRTDEASQALSIEDDFFTAMNNYNNRARELRELDTPEANILALELEERIAEIEELTDPNGSNRPHHDPLVLEVKDYLDSAYAEAGLLLLRFDFNTEILALKEKDAELEQSISDLRDELTERMEASQGSLQEQISALVTQSETDDAALKQELIDLLAMQEKDLQGRLTDFEERLALFIESSNGEDENLKNQITNLQGQMARVMEHIRALENADNNILIKIAELRGKVDSNAEMIRHNNRLIYDLKGEIVIAINNGNSDLAAELKRMEAKLLTEVEDLNKENEKVKEELKRQAQVDEDLSKELYTFKLEVNRRIYSLEKRVGTLEAKMVKYDKTMVGLSRRLSGLTGQVNNMAQGMAAAIRNMMASISHLKAETEKEILKLTQINNELKEQMKSQEEALTTLLNTQNQLGDLYAKMCRANDERQTCAAAGDSEEGNCCLTLSSINCEDLFGANPESVALGQCNAIVMTLKSHDEKLQALEQSDKEQENLLGKLIDEVEELNERVDDVELDVKRITQGMNSLYGYMKSLSQRMVNIDRRLMIEEFKSARAEAIASIEERNFHYLAWITRRISDVKTQFCHRNSKRAFNMSDYYVARHNFDYCHEKLTLLNRAKEMVFLAQAYAKGAASTNIDVQCRATIAGKSAENLSVAELTNKDIFSKLVQSCQGGRSLTAALLLNVVKLQDTIGPDFRTVAYFKTKAPIVQFLYLGGPYAKVSTDVRNKVELYDPTLPHIAETYFGQVERVFQNNYVKSRLRDMNNAFIADASKIPAAVAGLGAIFTHKMIKDAGNPYLVRLRALELKGFSNDVGHRVVRRNVTSRGGKKRFSFPGDPVGKCPVINDVVISKTTTGEYKTFVLNYSRSRGATEVVRAIWNRPIAKNDSDMNQGNFGICPNRWQKDRVHRFGMPNTVLRGRMTLGYWHPYKHTHNKPQCRRHYVTCAPSVDELAYEEGVSSSDNVLHYLSGFEPTRIENFCKVSGATYTHNVRSLSQDEKADLWTVDRSDSASGLAMARTNDETRTQLGENYWQYKDGGSSVIGAGLIGFSKSKPIYSVTTAAHSSRFFRKFFRPTDLEIKVQQCYDPGTE